MRLRLVGLLMWWNLRQHQPVTPHTHGHQPMRGCVLGGGGGDHVISDLAEVMQNHAPAHAQLAGFLDSYGLGAGRRSGCTR